MRSNSQKLAISQTDGPGIIKGSEYINNAKRESSFELLRIISMFSIAINHFASHGGFEFNMQSLTIPRLWWEFIVMGGKFGVNIFVLISGYFLIKSQNGTFNTKRILKYWGQVFFYSVLIYIIFFAVGITDFSLYSIVKALLPITFNQWWFASTYFVLFLIHLFLNVLLNKLDRNMYQRLLILLVVMWCLIPTLTGTSFQSNNFLWFITLYSVAGYIRIFGLNPKYSIRHYISIWLISTALRYFSSVVLIMIGTRIAFAAENSHYFYGMQTLLTFLCSLSFFTIFVITKIGYHKWINILASATFGVYLIHDNEIVRSFLWGTMFNNSFFQDSTLLIPYSIVVTILVYSFCTFIDLIRINTIERLYLSKVSKEVVKIEKPIRTIVKICNTKIFGN